MAMADVEEEPWGKIVVIKRDGSEVSMDLFDEVADDGGVDPYVFGR